MSPEDQKMWAPETPAMKEALGKGVAGPVEISSIEFYGPGAVLEELVREEDDLISKANVTAESEMREMLKNLPKGCCN
jgi:hypothetical protein